MKVIDNKTRFNRIQLLKACIYICVNFFIHVCFYEFTLEIFL